MRRPAAFLLVLLIATALAPAAEKDTPTGTEVVTVDLAKSAGAALYRASGFLHGFSNDGLLPPDDMVLPLKVQLHRTRPAATWSQAARMKALGIRQQVVISDGWGYTKEHPGDGGNWEKWETFVADMVRDAARRGLRPQWDIWNEPDHKFFWQRPPEQFDEAWRRAYVKIRQVDPGAEIVGPSWSGVHPGQPRFDEFVLGCQKHRVVPDHLCWHFPKDMVKEVRACRAFLAEHRIAVKGIMINEYCLKHEQVAGRTAWLIAQVERSGADATCHAIWGDEGRGNLDGLLDDPARSVPRGQWWAYRRYADITGTLVETVPGAKIDLVAGKDPAARTVRVLLGSAGGFTGDVTVRFRGLDQAAFLIARGKVHVTVERIPEADHGPVPSLPVVVEKDVAPADGVIEVTIPWASDRDAWAVRLGPPPDR